MAPPAFLHPFARPASEEFVTIVRGEGAIVWDDAGNRYVDALASLWYCAVGHGRAEIADAVHAQMLALESFHTFDKFTNEPAERLTERLVDLAPMPGARVFLTCSGSEAVDTAIKLARLAAILRGEPNRRIVVGRSYSYHGTAYGGTSVQGLPLNQEGWGPLLGDVVQVTHDDLGEVEKLFADRGDEIAAVLAEPVIGAGGVHPPAPGYLDGLRRLCSDHGALLVMDEVICGFGRLGAWWGSQRYGVRPDMATFAKAVTSGYQPLGGVLVGREVREALESDPAYVLRTGFTYSGHPAACAAALVNLDVVEREGLVERAVAVGERLEAGLRSIESGLVAGVRGDGAVWAAAMPEGVDGVAVRDAMMRRGVIARALGPTAVAFCPPLVIGDDDLDRCVEALGTAVREVRRGDDPRG
jgi:putrescine---pyruvate transaminase